MTLLLLALHYHHFVQIEYKLYLNHIFNNYIEITSVVKKL